MRSLVLRKFGLCAVLCASVFAACSESPTETPEPQQSLLWWLQPDNDPEPLRCPTDQTLTHTEIITPLGGQVRVGGTLIWIPQGALTLPTTITVTVPASEFMEIDITANGLESFLFQQPVLVAIDYSRCPDFRLMQGRLSVWYWDRDTGELLENMNGLDLRFRELMIFSTTHLSGYVIAN